MKRSHRLPLLGVMATLMLTACGVPPSDVIQAGAPASGMIDADSKPSVPVVISLYFLNDGVPTAYPRTIDASADFRTVLDQLFDGPTTREARTATTELPRLRGTTEATVGTRGEVSVQLPKDAAPLNHSAMLQLVCTVAHLSGAVAEFPADASRDGAHAPYAPVRVHGDGWMKSLSAESCSEPLQT